MTLTLLPGQGMPRVMRESDNSAWGRSLAGRVGQGLLVGLLLLTPIVFWRGGLEPFESCKVVVLQLTALALLVTGATWLSNRVAVRPSRARSESSSAVSGGFAACSAALRARFGQARKPGVCLTGFITDPVSLAMVLCAAAACLATVNSLSPRISWFGLYENGMGFQTTLALLVVYFAARKIFDAGRNNSFLVTSAIVAVVPVTLYALLQMAHLDPFVWDETSAFAHWTRPFSTLGHPNYLAGYIVMVLPLVLWLGWQCATSGRRRLALALAGLAAVSCGVAVCSLSRSAWLVILLEVIAVLAFGVWWLLKKPLPAARRKVIFLALLLAVLAGTVSAFALRMSEPFRQRVQQIAGLGGRGPIWTGAWHIFLEHPWTGCGLETFDYAFRQQGTAAFWRWEWGKSATRAHNDLLHTLATQGFPGGLAFLFLAGALAWAVYRAWRFGQANDRPLVIALSLSLLAWYVQNSFGFPVAPTACLFVVHAAQLSHLAWPVQAHARELHMPDAQARERGTHRLMRLTSPTHKQGILSRHSLACASGLWITLALVTAYFLIAKPYLAACTCQRGEQLRKSDLSLALDYHERAVRLDPGQDLLWNKLGTCALLAAESSPDSLSRRELLKRAAEATNEACRLVPASSENHANRARALYVLARERLATAQDVLDAYATALALDPDNTLYLADAAGAAVGLGLVEQARQYIGRGLRIDPDLGVLHANLAAAELARGRYATAEIALLRSLAGSWHDVARRDQALLLLCLTYLDTARAGSALRLADDLLGRQDSLPVRCLRARALEKLGRRQEAWAEYRRIVRARPGNAAARAGLVRLEHSSRNGKSRQGLPAGSAD